MSWFRFIGAIIDLGLGVVEVGVDTYGRARRLLRKKRPPAPAPSQPLTYRDVVRQQEQIRRATIRPPPPGNSNRD